jgi:hypothetical protein
MSTRDYCLAWLAETQPPDPPINSLQSALSGREFSPHDSALSLRLSLKRKRSTLTMNNNNATHGVDHEMQQIAECDLERTPTQPSKKRKKDTSGSQMETSSQAPSSATSSQGQSRSYKGTSPAKGLNQLSAKSVSVTSTPLTHDCVARFPDATRTLIRNLRQCFNLRAKVPASLKDVLREKYTDDDIWEREDIWWDATTTTKDHAPSLPEVEGIALEAIRCEDFDEYEVGWNSHSHGPLLAMATRLSRHCKHIKTTNITLARPMRRLRPSLLAGPTGKMVDFGMVLQVEKSDSLFQAWKGLRPEDDGTRYFNHTDAPQIAQKPIVVSIETKRSGSGEAEGNLQLQIWVAAQFQRLAEIRKTMPSSQRVYLPLLLVLGSEWYYRIAEGIYGEDGGLVEITVYQKQAIGDVKSVGGVFSVLGALHALIKWAHEVYRPWFEEWMGIKKQDANVHHHHEQAVE